MNTNDAAWQRCFRKKLFFERADAEAHMTWLWQQHGANGMEVYECEIGNAGSHFHVGHAPRQASRQNKLDRLRTFGTQTVLTRA